MTSDESRGPQRVADAEAFAADLDVGARNPLGWQGSLIAGVALLWAVLQVYNASPMPALIAQWTGLNWFYVNSDIERIIHLAFGLTLATLAFPMFKGSPRDRIPWYDWLLIAGGLFATFYLIVFSSAIADRAGLPTTGDLWASAIGLSVVLIATYRALGLPMVIVAFFFLMYVFFGDAEFFPDAMQWKGASFGKAMWHFWMQTEGVFGLALGVSASMVFLFVLFGSLLEKAGAGNYFIKLAFALMGHLKGGPAKAAVVASAATGLISGSSIANTVTTGTFTIPLMKRVGFPAEKAGAVEVASSTNGQLTPPVMGAAAFLMVEYVGISYLEVVKHAFLPAIISYIALVYIVHLEAAKMGLEGLPRKGAARSLAQKLASLALGVAVFCALCLGIYYGLGWLKPVLGSWSLPGMMVLFFAAYLVLLRWAAQYPDLEIDDPNAPFTELPEPGPVAKTGYYYILPVVVLIWNLMIERLSPGLSAFWATLAMIFVMLTQHPLKAMFRGEGLSDWARGWAEFLDGMISGSRNMIGIAVATGTAGIIVGTVSLTGAHQVIGEFIEAISGGNLLLMLIFVALFSLVLGMGLPTTATYIVITSLMAPVIIAVGAKSGLIVPLIAVHMFVFYFGILADDTPPVGLAAFAAAAISKGDPIKTGVIGFSYDVRTAILPFLFIFNTELLLIDVTPAKAVFVFIVAVIAMMLFAAATQSWFLTRSKMWENLALLLIAFTLFRPGFWLDMVEDPYVEVEPAKLVELAGNAPDGASLRARLTGENFATGKIDTVTVRLPLGNQADGDGAMRLDRHAGIAFRTEDDGKVYVDNLAFGGDLQQQGVDFDWEVEAVEQEADRMPKEVFYAPALLLLLLVIWLQRGRVRRAQPATA
ncbi:TRAP transporter permease [Marimonas lutisalis]|uniref:TRAP transporter permease n=1 Tax=Marimonas lutisalis TaxID=2545756 RepID=UPI0010F924E1|nr:TRAP transporter permease [Marimonas lutisalis]